MRGPGFDSLAPAGAMKIKRWLGCAVVRGYLLSGLCYSSCSPKAMSVIGLSQQLELVWSYMWEELLVCM